MEQIVMMAMQTMQEYAQKSAAGALCEYEMLAYEQLCIFIASWCKGHELVLRRQLGELEQSAIQAETEHAEWKAAQDDDEEEEEEKE